VQIVCRAGNFLDGGIPVVAHGCNARGATGAGAARAVRDRHPGAHSAYRQRFESGGLRLGEVVWADLPVVAVANMVTQDRYGRDGARHVDHDAVSACVRGLDRRARAKGWRGIAMTPVGASLGGGDWGILSAIVEREATAFVPVVFTLDGRRPGAT